MTVNLSVHSFSVGLHHKLNMFDGYQKYFSIAQFNIIFHFCSLLYGYRLLINTRAKVVEAYMEGCEFLMLV